MTEPGAILTRLEALLRLDDLGVGGEREDAQEQQQRQEGPSPRAAA